MVGSNQVSGEDKYDPAEVLSVYESSVKELEENKNILEKLRAEASRVAPWGNFDDDTFKKLQGSGWTLSLFSCPQKSFNLDWNTVFIQLRLIGRKTGRVYFTLIHRDGEIPEIDADPEKKPGSDLHRL